MVSFCDSLTKYTINKIILFDEKHVELPDSEESSEADDGFEIGITKS